MKRDRPRLTRLARAHESLFRMLEARLLAEEAKARDISAKLCAMETSAQHIPISFLPAALRNLMQANALRQAVEGSAASLRQQCLAVKGRCQTISSELEIAESERTRKSEEEVILEFSLSMAKASGKQGMVK